MTSGGGDEMSGPCSSLSLDAVTTFENDDDRDLEDDDDVNDNRPGAHLRERPNPLPSAPTNKLRQTELRLQPILHSALLDKVTITTVDSINSYYKT